MPQHQSKQTFNFVNTFIFQANKHKVQAFGRKWLKIIQWKLQIIQECDPLNKGQFVEGISNCYNKQ